MREILFRGKRLDNGEWVYGSLMLPSAWDLQNGGDNTIIADQTDSHCYAVDVSTVGQYTGLTNKNGVKIFEGDILLIGDSPDPVLVEFVNFSWECTSKNIGPYYRHRLEHNPQKYEVIGNIHDKSDLLTFRDNG